MNDSQFSIRPVTARNAAHVAGVFRALYGDDFPIGYVYDADLLLAELAGGRLCAALACDGDGRAVGYISCYRCAPNANRVTKDLLLQNAKVTPDQMVEMGANAFARALHGTEVNEGTTAFFEKRPPRWSSDSSDTDGGDKKK